MGGREGGRGYLYQSIATLMSSLIDEEWEFVQVEADTENDKVDILWEYLDHKSKVVQVKSSQNNISKSQIVKWTLDLVEDAPEANIYQLFLIGNVSDETSKFISKTKRWSTLREDDIDYKLINSIKDYLSKLEIIVQNYQLESLEASMKWGMTELLSKMGHTVSSVLVEQIVGALVYQFTKFSTQGLKTSRKTYLNQIEEWIYFNYPEIKGNSFKKKSLKVEFYGKNITEINDKMKSFQMPFTTLLRRKDLQQTIKEIDRIKLPPFEENIEEDKTHNLGLSLSRYNPVTKVPFELSSEDKEEMRGKVKKLLHTKLPEDFFNVGNLVETTSQMATFNSKNKFLEGTLEEKQKGELIDSFISDLYEFESLINYMAYLEGFFIIPLILENTGSYSDDDITVNLIIPAEIEILSKKNIQQPTMGIIDLFIGEDNILNTPLKHQKAYNLEEHYSNSSSLFLQSHLMSPFYGLSKESKIEDFLSTIEWFFEHEIFEEKDFTVLQYNFKSLHAGKNMAFPSYILVKACKSFEIEYDITSKNLDAPVKGKLYYNLN